MTFLLLLILPLLVAVGAFIFLKGITWKEFALHLGAQLIIAGISAWVIYHQNTGDTEIWGGAVTYKQRETVSCSHSYQCNCRSVTTCTGTGKDRTCSSSTVCDTCYEHLHDYDWNVYTSNRETITIDRIDRQGVGEPPRWTVVKVMDPTALPHGYTSYIKAAPDTLFRHQGLKQKYAGKLPSYPGRVYDYYRVNRLVLQGVSVVDPGAWNEGLMKINADIGARKQVSMAVVITDQPSEWYYALEESWIGGKKNDAILVIGLEPGSLKPAWAQVMAWTTAKIYEIKLRDAVMALPEITPGATLKVLHDMTEEHYKRKPMKDFEYIQASITPSVTQMAVATLIGLIIAGILTVLFQVYDVFGDERRSFGFRRNRLIY
jgi:hypothetical protein